MEAAKRISKAKLLPILVLAFFSLQALFATYYPQYLFKYGLYAALSILVFNIFVFQKRFVHDWLLVFVMLIAFNSLRSYIYEFITTYNLPIHSQYAISFEHLFVPNNTLAHILQQSLTTANQFNALQLTLILIYATHFIYFIFAGALLWYHHPQSFWRYKYGILACSYIGLLIYLLLPTTPPWLASEQGLIPHVQNTFIDFTNARISTLVKLLDTNPVAAMPSLHIAFPAFTFLAVTCHSKRHINGSLISGYSAFTLCFLIAQITATLVLGAHFIADILAGILLAAALFYIFYIRMAAKPYNANPSFSDIGLECGKLCFLLMLMSFVINIF